MRIAVNLDDDVLYAVQERARRERRSAQVWLDDNLARGWASCALTENGFVRIISQRRYPSAVSTRDAVHALSTARAT